MPLGRLPGLVPWKLPTGRMPGWVVPVTGAIDEDNELTSLTDKIPAGTAVIDLGEIERINSCGVRDWVNWLGRVEAKPARVVLIECSPPIVAQINLVSNFTGGGSVKSFYAPYFCAECNQEKVLLVDVADLGEGGGPIEPPTCRCDDCDLVMDFDDMPDSYFAFLTAPGRLRLADADQLDSVLREFASAGAAERGKVRPRTSNPNLGHGTPVASVPSLQSIARVSASLPARAASPAVLELAPVAPPVVVAPPVIAAPRPLVTTATAPTTRAPRTADRSSKVLLVVMITALALSTALLVYLLVT